MSNDNKTPQQKEEEKRTKLLNECLYQTTHESVAELFIHVSKLTILCHDLRKYNGYFFNKETTLYEEIGVEKLSALVRKILPVFLKRELNKRLKAISENTTIEEDGKDKEKSKLRKHFKALQNYVESVTYTKNVAISVMCKCECEDFMYAKADASPDTVNFKNGLVNLRTGEFRKRTKDDYVTKCLDYDYKPERNKEIENYIMTNFRHMWNDDDELIEENLKWTAYNITGETYMKKGMFNFGSSADNAKSTFSNIFEKCFSIYSTKLKSDTFKKGNQTAHKTLYNIQNPVRRAFIEELDDEKLDVTLLKEFIDGRSLMVEHLYSVTKKHIVFAKLNLNSNYLPKFRIDAGVKSRFFMNILENQFLDKAEYDKQKQLQEKQRELYKKRLESYEKKVAEYKEKGEEVPAELVKPELKLPNIYLKNDDFYNNFDKEEYKLGFFHILLDYTIKIYKKKLTDDDFKQSRKNFLDLVIENDAFKQFIDDNFIITGNDEDRVSKDDFVDIYRRKTNLKNVTFRNLLSDIKRLKLNYNRGLRPIGAPKGHPRGVIIGIKPKEISEDDEGGYDVESGVVMLPSDDDIMAQNKQLKYENQKLKEEIERLKEMLEEKKKIKDQ